MSVSRYTNLDISHTFYVRLIEACNMYCKHCFIPNNPSVLSGEIVRKIPDYIDRYTLPGDTILFQFHGGEPTLYGIGNINSIIEMIKNTVHDRKLLFSIQTNLRYLNPDLIELIKTHFDSEVGVSWDPEIRYLKKGVPSSNEIYDEIFWNNYANCINVGLTPYLTITTTKNFFKYFSNSMDFFIFLQKKEVSYVHLERLTKSGWAKENWKEIGIDNHEYSYNMIRIFNAYVQYTLHANNNDYRKIHLSPFDDLIESFRTGAKTSNCCWSGKCDTTFHTIDSDGYKQGCTALTANKTFNIVNLVDIRKARKNICVSCDFANMCSTGCVDNSVIDESRECSGASELLRAISSYVAKEKENEKIRYY